MDASWIYINFNISSQDETKPTKNYRGVHFGKLTSKRLDLSVGRQGPGPGEYEPYRELMPKAENVNAEEPPHVKFEARIPRYHEAIVKDEEKRVGIKVTIFIEAK